MAIKRLGTRLAATVPTTAPGAGISFTGGAKLSGGRDGIYYVNTGSTPIVLGFGTAPTSTDYDAYFRPSEAYPVEVPGDVAVYEMAIGGASTRSVREYR